MNKEQKVVLKSVRGLSHEVLFYADRFVAFGSDEYNDLLITGRLKSSTPQSVHVAADKQILKSHDARKELYRRAINLLDQGAIGSFSLTAQTKQRVDTAIDKLNASHLRLYSNRDGIHLLLFDVRRFEPQYRVSRKFEVLAVTDTISSQASYTFSSTLLAKSFRRIPRMDYGVIVSPNGITQFKDIDQRTYAFRDQGVREPLHTFVSELLGKDISFWLHPKSALLNPDTSPI